MADVPDGFVWPGSWKPLPLPEQWIGRVDSLEAELRSEVSAGHPLFGVPCSLVGWNSASLHEFLFSTAAPGLPLAFVHLTWRAETDPRWPRTTGYAGWEAFLAAWSSHDAEPVAPPNVASLSPNAAS
jgi:hypothetical protein